MMIEVGKKYINASGEVVTIIEEDKESIDYCICDINLDWYTDNGDYQIGEKNNKDLICEVNEDIYTAYKQDLITKEEFLNKHFELYAGMTLEQYNAKNQDNQKID